MVDAAVKVKANIRRRTAHRTRLPKNIQMNVTHPFIVANMDMFTHIGVNFDIFSILDYLDHPGPSL